VQSIRLNGREIDERASIVVIFGHTRYPDILKHIDIILVMEFSAEIAHKSSVLSTSKMFAICNSKGTIKGSSCTGRGLE
jgi:hypothetical protein